MFPVNNYISTFPEKYSSPTLHINSNKKTKLAHPDKHTAVQKYAPDDF